MAAPQPPLCRLAFEGIYFSCVPQPSSAGCKPSEIKPSTDQVLMNTFIGFGCLTLTPTSCAMLSKACLTNQDTMPGLAPQHDTAVGPPGRLRRAARMLSRNA